MRAAIAVVLWSVANAVLAGPADDLVAAALERTTHAIDYDGRYLAIDYPMGDVPTHIGVCTDVLIRSYRQLGVDLQQLVHEDMRANFANYPKRWGLTRPDPNIDHRRVPNLERFFARQGDTLPISNRGKDYLPGDLVSWRLANNLPHIGIVSNRAVEGSDRFQIIHNIGNGPELADVLFHYRIVGHYRYPARSSLNRRAVN